MCFLAYSYAVTWVIWVSDQLRESAQTTKHVESELRLRPNAQYENTVLANSPEESSSLVLSTTKLNNSRPNTCLNKQH